MNENAMKKKPIAIVTVAMIYNFKQNDILFPIESREKKWKEKSAAKEEAMEQVKIF